MRRRRPLQNLIGVILLAAGTLILLAKILPVGFWWCLFALGLIVLGLNWTRAC